MAGVKRKPHRKCTRDASVMCHAPMTAFRTHVFHQLHSAPKTQPNTPARDRSNESSKNNLQLICLLLLRFPHRHQHYAPGPYMGEAVRNPLARSHLVQRAQYRHRWQFGATQSVDTQHKALDKHCVYVQQRRRKNLTEV